MVFKQVKNFGNWSSDFHNLTDRLVSAQGAREEDADRVSHFHLQHKMLGTVEG